MRRFWTKQELRELKRRYPHEQTCDTAKALGRSERAVYAAAGKLGLHKSAKYLASPAAHRFDGKKGGQTRFPKGHEPWNKGTHFVAGGRSAKTRFKKGNKPHTWVPVGAERVTKDGVLERKVSDRGGYNNRDWKPVHVLIWEKDNGPVPKGRLVVFKDRNRANFDRGNLECITRAENMRRNTYHRYGKDVARLIQLRGALNRQINKRGRNEESNRRSA